MEVKACGALCGVFHTYLKIPSFIVTLGISYIYKGIALLLTNAYPVIGMTERFEVVGRGYVLGIPVPIIIMFAAYFIGWFTLKYTKFGRSAYAIGGNAEAAQLSGISVKRNKVLIFAIGGLTAGLAGVILASRMFSGQPTACANTGPEAIAAVTIGGTSAKAGRGRMWGPPLGSLIMGMISNALNIMKISPYYQFVALGAVLVKMKYCGVCSSELEPWKTASPGQEFGHEPVGTVEALGDEVTGFALQDRVTGLSSPCYAQYTIMKAEHCVPIPDEVADEDAMGEALSCLLNVGAQMSLAAPGDPFVVVGCGYMGLGTISLMRAMGAGTIIGVDLREEARENALKYGADITYSPGSLPEEFLFSKYDFGGHVLGREENRRCFPLALSVWRNLRGRKADSGWPGISPVWMGRWESAGIILEVTGALISSSGTIK